MRDNSQELSKEKEILFQELESYLENETINSMRQVKIENFVETPLEKLFSLLVQNSKIFTEAELIILFTTLKKSPLIIDEYYLCTYGMINRYRTPEEAEDIMKRFFENLFAIFKSIGNHKFRQDIMNESVNIFIKVHCTSALKDFLLMILKSDNSTYEEKTRVVDIFFKDNFLKIKIQIVQDIERISFLANICNYTASIENKELKSICNYIFSIYLSDDKAFLSICNTILEKTYTIRFFETLENIKSIREYFNLKYNEKNFSKNNKDITLYNLKSIAIKKGIIREHINELFERYPFSEDTLRKYKSYLDCIQEFSTVQYTIQAPSIKQSDQDEKEQKSNQQLKSNKLWTELTEPIKPTQSILEKESNHFTHKME